MIIRSFCNSVFIIVISLCAKFVVSNGLRPSDFGSYQTPPFNNDSPVAPSNSGFPDQEQTSFQQQYYQQQVRKIFVYKKNYYYYICRLIEIHNP